MKITAETVQEHGVWICRARVQERRRGKLEVSTTAAAHPTERGAWEKCGAFIRGLTPRPAKDARWPSGSAPVSGARRRR